MQHDTRHWAGRRVLVCRRRHGRAACAALCCFLQLCMLRCDTPGRCMLLVERCMLQPIAIAPLHATARNQVFNVGADLPYTVEHLALVVGRAMGLENVRARSCMRARVCGVRIRVRSPFCSGRPVVLNRVLVASARVVQHATISRSAKARARSVVRPIGVVWPNVQCCRRDYRDR